MSARALLLLAAALFAGEALPAARNLDAERIATTLAQLEADPVRSTLAGAEIARARAALLELERSGRRKKQREHLAYLAERRVDIAFAAAQAALDERKLVDLQREHQAILLEASRREAELARIEAEKLRVQSLAREEETERLREETAEALAAQQRSAVDAENALATAAQARRVAAAQAEEAALARREAELAGAAAVSLRVQMEQLAATRDARGRVLTLGDGVFRPGGSALEAEAVANFDKVLGFANSAPLPLRIEGHTDDRGSAESNQRLSQKRADAVRAALVARGVDPARVTAIGRGEDAPIAANDSSDGRARNRRVELVLEGG